MSIMTQLEFQLHFTNSEKLIADYILETGEDVLNMSIKTLSKNTYSSPATIVRLCRKIGLEGFNDFKIKYSAELQYQTSTQKRIDVNFPFSEHDSYQTISHNLLEMSKEVLDETMLLLDYKQIEKIVDLLDKNDDIDIYGNGNSLLCALSFQHKCMRIGKHVNLRPIDGEQVFLAFNSSPKRLSILLSYSGETDEMIRIAQALRQRGSYMIGITSIGDNRLSKLCHENIHVGSREKIFTKIAPFASNLSMEYVMNVLFSCLFSKHYHKNIDTKMTYDKRYDYRHPSNSPINDE